MQALPGEQPGDAVARSSSPSGPLGSPGPSCGRARRPPSPPLPARAYLRRPQA